MDFDELQSQVEDLHHVGARHIRLDFKLSETTTEQICERILTEAAELYVATLEKRTHNDVMFEIGDVLCCLMSLVVAYGFSWDTIMDRASDKLNRRFAVAPKLPKGS